MQVDFELSFLGLSSGGVCRRGCGMAVTDGRFSGGSGGCENPGDIADTLQDVWISVILALGNAIDCAITARQWGDLRELVDILQQAGAS